MSVRFPISSDELDETRRGRDEGHGRLVEVFCRWQLERGRRFEEWFQEEADGLGQALWESYLEYLRRWAGIVAGDREPSTEDILPSDAVVAVHEIQHAFGNEGLPEEEKYQKTMEFLHSPTLREIPVVRIQALLFAALAHQAANGRSNLPSRGTFTDIRVVSTLLPYCDAMLVDHELRGLLQFGPVRTGLEFPTKLFSGRELDEFLAFLDEIEDAANPEHLRVVEDIYGPVRPFTSLFENEDSTQES